MQERRVEESSGKRFSREVVTQSSEERTPKTWTRGERDLPLQTKEGTPTQDLRSRSVTTDGLRNRGREDVGPRDSTTGETESPRYPKTPSWVIERFERAL